MSKPLSRTAAGKLALIQEMLDPNVYAEDGKTVIGQKEPLITKEQALEMLNGPNIDNYAGGLIYLSEDTIQDTSPSEDTKSATSDGVWKMAAEWHSAWVDSDDSELLDNEFTSKEWGEEWAAAFAAGRASVTRNAEQAGCGCRIVGPQGTSIRCPHGNLITSGEATTTVPSLFAVECDKCGAHYECQGCHRTLMERESTRAAEHVCNGPIHEAKDCPHVTRPDTQPIRHLTFMAEETKKWCDRVQVLAAADKAVVKEIEQLREFITIELKVTQVSQHDNKVAELNEWLNKRIMNWYQPLVAKYEKALNQIRDGGAPCGVQANVEERMLKMCDIASEALRTQHVASREEQDACTHPSDAGDICAQCRCIKAGHHPAGCEGSGGNCGCTGYVARSDNQEGDKK